MVCFYSVKQKGSSFWRSKWRDGGLQRRLSVKLELRRLEKRSDLKSEAWGSMRPSRS